MRQITVPLAVAVVALSAACGGSHGPREPASASPATTAATAASAATTTAPAGATTDAAAGIATVARTDTPLDVYAAPGDAAPRLTLPAATGFGSPRALLVDTTAADTTDAADRTGAGWVPVLLPTRPNGGTGWVRRDQVELRTVDEAVTIDLAARTLTLSAGDEVVLTTPVAVGTDRNPTPTGAFYVVDKLDTGNAGGAYGPFAFGLSAHSDTLSEFGGGDGQVGIHGTDDPSSIGRAASHGCIRVPNDVAVRLAATLDLGTPVTIVG
jgi:lipoprotein-anchoring transpeptidase ErfK/SrfK